MSSVSVFIFQEHSKILASLERKFSDIFKSSTVWNNILLKIPFVELQQQNHGSHQNGTFDSFHLSTALQVH